jgi:hypothetical protein
MPLALSAQDSLTVQFPPRGQGDVASVADTYGPGVVETGRHHAARPTSENGRVESGGFDDALMGVAVHHPTSVVQREALVALLETPEAVGVDDARRLAAVVCPHSDPHVRQLLPQILDIWPEIATEIGDTLWAVVGTPPSGGQGAAPWDHALETLTLLVRAKLLSRVLTVEHGRALQRALTPAPGHRQLANWTGAHRLLGLLVGPVAAEMQRHVWQTYFGRTFQLPNGVEQSRHAADHAADVIEAVPMPGVVLDAVPLWLAACASASPRLAGCAAHHLEMARRKGALLPSMEPSVTRALARAQRRVHADDVTTRDVVRSAA